jgi:coproporphyrinogen III oxidase-like Fe-S oxidoreductase
VAALGPTGTGYFAQGLEKAYRYKWKPGRAEVEVENLTLKELGLEKLYLRLRLSEPFRIEEFTGVLDFEKRLEIWQKRGLVLRVDNAWQMTPAAWVILDSLLNELFSAAST